MNKWIGCILIIAASTGLGMSRSEELKKHLEQLEELKKLFYLLRSELAYTKAPFAEVFEKLEYKVASPFREWLLCMRGKLVGRQIGSFWEVWRSTISEKLTKSKLKEEDLEELRNVGKNLEYIENIDLYIEQLEYKITQIRQSYQTKRKLCRSLGIMGGIFLVILLL